MSHTIELPDELYAQLETLAHNKGQTPEQTAAQLLNAAVSDGKNPSEQAATVPNSPLFEIMGMFSTPIGDIEPGWIERHDEMIAEEALDPHAEE